VVLVLIRCRAAAVVPHTFAAWVDHAPVNALRALLDLRHTAAAAAGRQGISLE
jgi:hypothetical protein